ncbi:hypothetical protein GCM10027063_34060 [Promicromonospora xylanilytica]
MLDVLADIRVSRTRPGRPRTCPEAVLADRTYVTSPIRKHLGGRVIKTVIHEKRTRSAARQRKGSADGRPPALDAELYKQRNVVEHPFLSCE